jgi:hypothetical protein
MKPVEQAIFTSVETGCQTGYQVVASSTEICAADVHELAVWEPSRDSMLEPDTEPESFNFHPLPSGTYCVSRSTPGGWEHDGAQRTYTHCLLVPPEVLARFANNPFALIQAMSEHGLWQHGGAPCLRLESFSPPGGAAPVDQTLLRQLAVDPGPERMAALVQQARSAVCLAIAGACRPASLMAGLFSCLPPECRLEFSFSTGLKFSPRRPFRMVALSDDPAERLWVAGYPNVVVLELRKDAAPQLIPLDGWAALIERTLTADHIPFLAAQISKRRFDLALNDLPALGLQLLESLDSAEFRGDDGIQVPVHEVAQQPSAEESVAAGGGRTHAAHRQFEKSAAPRPATLPPVAPPDHGALHSPEVLEKLEYLDDLVYEAISGQTTSLERLRTAWPRLCSELSDDDLVESREQYLRYALSIWTECVDAGAIRNPTRAIQALDVLCLLFGDTT